MYVHISAPPEKFLTHIGVKKVSHNGTLFKGMLNFLEQQRGQKSAYLLVT